MTTKTASSMTSAEILRYLTTSYELSKHSLPSSSGNSSFWTKLPETISLLKQATLTTRTFAQDKWAENIFLWIMSTEHTSLSKDSKKDLVVIAETLLGKGPNSRIKTDIISKHLSALRTPTTQHQRARKVSDAQVLAQSKQR